MLDLILGWKTLGFENLPIAIWDETLSLVALFCRLQLGVIEVFSSVTAPPKGS